MNKICFVTIGDLKINASPKRAFGLANPMTKLGWEVSVLMYDTEENRKRAKAELDTKVKVCFYKNNSTKQQCKEKNRLIEEIDPDVLYIGYMYEKNIVARKHRSIKIVEHCELYSKYSTYSFKRKLYQYAMELYSIIYADGLVCSSIYLQNIYKHRKAKLLKNKVKLLYLPYAYSPEYTIVKPHNNIKENIIQYSQKACFIYLGSVYKVYGIFTILEAANILNKKRCDFNILILGGGTHLNEAREYIKNHKLEDCVTLTGFVEEEDISDYFSIATAFLSPMHDTIQDWARCPSKLYMYLPYKKPVITCKIGEPFNTLGNDGLYYEPTDSVGMSQQMEIVLDGKKDKLNISPSEHTWEKRAIQFNEWLMKGFCKTSKK